MARVVRKVSSKATMGQKKEGRFFNSKKFWILISTIVIVLIAVAVTTGIIIYNNNKTEETKQVDDYFGKSDYYKNKDYNNNNQYEITGFNKSTYGALKMYTSSDSSDTDAGDIYVTYAIVFACDLSTFYPMDYYITDSDGNNQNQKNDEHEKIYKYLIQLQYEIEKYNETSDQVAKLFIIDLASKDGSENNKILDDQEFVQSSEDDIITQFISVHTEDGLQTKQDNRSIYTDSFHTMTTTTISNIIRCITEDFKKLSNE